MKKRGKIYSIKTFFFVITQKLTKHFKMTLKQPREEIFLKALGKMFHLFDPQKENVLSPYVSRETFGTKRAVKYFAHCKFLERYICLKIL